MANIFLDTNIFFDVAGRDIKKTETLINHRVYLSPLSCHIYCYSEGVVIPDKTLISFFKNFEVVNLSEKIFGNALEGPTKDFEDNIQLHSAKKAKADYFLTSDRKLLKLGYFGKTKIISSL